MPRTNSPHPEERPKGASRRTRGEICSAWYPRACLPSRIGRIGKSMRQAETRGPQAAAVDAPLGGGMGDRTAVLRRKLAATATFCRYALHRFSRDGCFAASGALSYT